MVLCTGTRGSRVRYAPRQRRPGRASRAAGRRTLSLPDSLPVESPIPFRFSRRALSLSHPRARARALSLSVLSLSLSLSLLRALSLSDARALSVSLFLLSLAFYLSPLSSISLFPSLPLLLLFSLPSLLLLPPFSLSLSSSLSLSLSLSLARSLSLTSFSLSHTQKYTHQVWCSPSDPLPFALLDFENKVVHPIEIGCIVLLQVFEKTPGPFRVHSINDRLM